MHDEGVNVRDFTDGEAVYAAYDEQRSRCPVAWNSSYGGHYMLTSYDDVKGAAGDWESFSSATGIILPQDPRPMVPPIEFDPPEHGFWRGVIQELLSRRTRQILEARVLVEADRLIDTFAADGHADLVRQFAEPIPVLAIATLIGLDPELALQMREVGLPVTHTHGTPSFAGAMADFAAFALAQVNERRSRPREDFLTTLGSGEFEGRKLTDDQIVGVLISLMVAGHHSTVSALSSLLLHTAADPALRAELVANPRLLARAVEETVRLHTPLHTFRRRTTADVHVGGTTIPQHSDVLLNYAAANRDPDTFPEPHVFDLNRVGRAHVGFGYGIHTCAGAPLARAEIRLATQRLLTRLPDLTLVGRPPRHGFDGHLLMLDELRVRFFPAEINQG